MMLDLTPGISRFQVCVSILAYSAGFIALWLSAIPLELQLALSLTIGVAAAAHWRDDVGDNPDRIVRVCYQEGWWLFLADGRVRKVELIGEAVVLSWVVSANFSDGRHRYTLSVFSDSVTKTEHRQLRARFSTAEITLPLWQLAVARWYQNRIRRMWRG
jgi:hypothetical protein